jgi:hypothetical protein
MSASRTILINGPHPITTSQNPILNQRLPKYLFIRQALWGMYVRISGQRIELL